MPRAITLRRAPQLDPVKVMHAKRLYMQGLPPSEIAPIAGFTKQQVISLANIRKWPALRQAKMEELERLTDEEINNQIIRAATKNASLESSRLLSKAISNTSAALDDGKNKDAMYASATAKNLADLSRLSSQDSPLSGPSLQITFNLQGLPSPEPKLINPPLALPQPTS